METQERKVLELELKYCERCGRLWLRLRGSEVILCRNCAKALAGVPCWPRRDQESDTEAADVAPNSAFWAEGGNA
jgi:ribosomal protein L37AE/L43A